MPAQTDTDKLCNLFAGLRICGDALGQKVEEIVTVLEAADALLTRLEALVPPATAPASVTDTMEVD